MCSQSVSGSSLLSGYDDDDARETSGRSRREFDQIDAVLYEEEASKRSSIKKICEEWSSKPHFRIRGRSYHIDREENINGIEATANTLSALDFLSSSLKIATATASFNFNDVPIPSEKTISGRSSIDSIEGSELTNDSDLDDADATNTILGDRFTNGADSFDTDEDDDENVNCSSTLGRPKYPQFVIKCLKDSVISTLASSLLERFLADHPFLLQRYVKLVCGKHSIKFRPKLRPSSLPPRSLSQHRLLLPIGSSMASTSSFLQQHQQMILASLPVRSTPEPNVKLTSLLRVTPLRIPNSIPITTIPSSAAASPRKSQVGAPTLPSPVEKISASVPIEKRNQQQISLTGTSVTNPSLQVTLSAPQPSQTQTRQLPATWRYRSATTINSGLQNFEPITRLPSITIERLTTSDQLTLNRSNTITTTSVESNIPVPRAVSGTSMGSNLSFMTKARTATNIGKLQRTSRPVTIFTNKDLNQSSSTSPPRSITGTTFPSTSFRTTAANRMHHQQPKRSSLTTKVPPPSSSASAIKISATHIC